MQAGAQLGLRYLKEGKWKVHRPNYLILSLFTGLIIFYGNYYHAATIMHIFNPK